MVDKIGGSSSGDALVGVIAEYLDAQPPGPSVTATIHGTLEPDLVARQITHVLSALGSSEPITDCLFHVASVGSVTGVVLADGRRLVVKAYQPSWRSDFLRGVLMTQDRLWRAGVPCGRPVGGPIRCGRGLATVETYLADPGQPDAFGDDERTTSAEGLALIVERAGFDDRLALHPLLPRSDSLYPPPHSPLFDFEATKEGAEWIDGLASLAKVNGPSGRRVIAHTDWSARNVRLGIGGIRAVFDLDSLAAIDLSAAVGKAAVTWRSLGEAGEPVAPCIEEVQDWFDRFPITLSSDERRASLAAALAVLCYTARCEHAIDPSEQRHLRARPRLREDAAVFRRLLTRRDRSGH